AGGDGAELGEFDRLRNVHVVTRAQGLKTIFDARVGGQRDRRNAASCFALERTDLLDQIVTVNARHADVADQNIGYFMIDRRKRFGSRTRETHSRAAVFESL